MAGPFKPEKKVALCCFIDPQIATATSYRRITGWLEHNSSKTFPFTALPALFRAKAPCEGLHPCASLPTLRADLKSEIRNLKFS
jgi:hypothetical protein